MKQKRTRTPPANAEIRRIAHELGWTRQALADALGVSIHTLRSWLKSPDAANFRRAPEIAVLLARRIKGEGL
jgi:DNA-binding transcriptional regulator YiaG